MEAYLQIEWNDAIDMVLVAILTWAALVWLRRARARLALVGLLFLGAVYLTARQLELELTAWLLQGFFAVLVIVLVVVFQDDLKRLFEHIALWGLRRRTPAPSADVVDRLARVVSRLAETRTGALLILPGRVPLERHIEGGVALDALVSVPLLLSLFDHHSPGHDGGVIVDGNRLRRFAVRLPLSSNDAAIGGRGTRHASALGLSEHTDALVIVVSEERGTVSIAHAGELRELRDPSRLTAEVRGFLAMVAPTTSNRERAWGAFVKRWPEGLAAVAITFLLWFVLVPGAGSVEVDRKVPVVVENLPPGYVLQGVDPPEVEVILSGPRRLVFLENRNDVKVRLDAFLVKLGRRTFQVGVDQVEAPAGITVLATHPEQVVLSVEEQSAAR